MEEKLIFNYKTHKRKPIALPYDDFQYKNLEDLIDPESISDNACENFPELSEPEVVRHFIRLSKLNFNVDENFYPLGSCTMKYNPKVNEFISRFKGFSDIHPTQAIDDLQGILRILFELGEYFKDLSGHPGVTLQPAAGAHGELTALFMMKAYFKDTTQNRNIILIPDTAHGTNPASAQTAGFKAIKIKSNADGDTDLEDLKAHLDDDFAGIMLTIPNTLGLFDKHILEISKLVKASGGFLYMDGANMNALMGKVIPADLGVDVMHFNLHKTFSAPHGGGGPGSGPITVCSKLQKYLPNPIIIKSDNQYKFNYSNPDSIGKVKEYFGNIGVLLKAYIYIKSLGAEGLKRVSEFAVLNANYIRKSLEEVYKPAFSRICMHECVFTNEYQEKSGVRTLNIAKRLLDYRVHAPTIYFPLIVHEALMIEPTETESKETLDNFIEIMKKIAQESKENPDLVKTAPHNVYMKKLDEVSAARNPILKWRR